jgi:hypothetical protein
MTSAPSDSYRQLWSEDPRVPGISLMKATFLGLLRLARRREMKSP